MSRFGIFVDAGYLFAQGSALLAGERQHRRLVDLDVPTAHAMLLRLGAAKAGHGCALRTYWYDGAFQGRISGQQSMLAETDGIKLRLGFINFAGEQKGVDALIVTDLIELARNRAIDDALVLSGDEDIMVGVLVAQSFGVRVHLLGIEPARGSQSQQLRMEADSTTEWKRADLASFMAVRRTEPEPEAPLLAWSPGQMHADHEPVGGEPFDSLALIATVVEEEFVGLLPDVLAFGRQHLADGKLGLPPEIDNPLLSACGRAVGRKLNEDEKRCFRRLARALLQGVPSLQEP
jgi:uncharacterized LabA/DUF88 family protein